MSSCTFGIEALEKYISLLNKLEGKRAALLGHPASLNKELTSSVDVLRNIGTTYQFRLSALFGPQHGFSGEKQDNMIESDDAKDKKTGVKVFSLYGKTRRLTDEMIDSFDTLFIDLQDVGVRVYTFLTALCYILEDLSSHPDKTVVVLDRPNPTGRAMDGLILEPGWESYVGITSAPMQHGLTLGEFALWYKAAKKLPVNLAVVPMEGYVPDSIADSWPKDHLWVQPSPNMPALYTARSYPGTVILEGTTLSEARGTTRPLSMFGHPEVNWDAVYVWLKEKAPAVIHGCFLRPVTFEPTFHKHAGIPTRGFEIITEGDFYDPALFKPYLLIASVLKAIHTIHPDLTLWTDPPYEYEFEKTPVDVITGGTSFRQWVESGSSTVEDLAQKIEHDKELWYRSVKDYFLY